MVLGDSNEENPNDPMVSNPVCPFVICVTLRNIHMYVENQQGALIDTKCTQCLMRQALEDDLGLCTMKL